MADYASANEVPWKDSIAAIETVTIRDNVTGIGAYAFSGCTSLNSVTISRKVTKIGNNAFENCTNLTDVYYAGTKDDWDVVNKGNINDCLTKVNISYCVCGANGNEANVKWSLDNDTLTISGSGAMESYNLGCTPWYASKENIQIVVIKEGVTEIGPGAFLACSNLQSVTIPDNVESIGAGTFWGCSNLQSVTIPKKVTSIGTGTFNSCTNLTSVKIPDDVKNIGANAFYGCTSLTSVTIPASVTSIGDNAFLNCTKLTDVYYTGTKAEWDALTKGSGNDSLTNVTLHYYVDSGTCGATGNEANVKWALDDNGTLTISGSGAMADYNARNIMPWSDNVKTIKTVVIENGVTNIGDYAFYGHINLKSVTMPNSVESIGINAFFMCMKLSDVYYTGTKAKWDELTKGSGNDSLTNATLYYNYVDGGTCGATTNDNVYWVLDGYGTLTISGSGAMEGYDKSTNKAPWNDSIATIKTVVIENGVTNVGDYAFCNCTNLTSVTIPDSVESIGTGTFWGCSNLQSVTIPKKVTSIGSSTFNSCANLTSVTIPDKVTSIGVAAFYGCTSLESVVIPKSVTSIGISAFLNCTNLTDVYYTGTKTQWDNGLDKGSGNDSLTNATLHYHCGATADDNVYWAQVGGTLTISGIGNMMNYSNKNEVPWKNIITAKIENGVKNIGDRTFRKCGLESIIIPKSVTEIGNNAFLWCDQLKLVTIPNSVKSIGFYAFSSCRSLTSVTMPKDIETIDHHAFSDCTSLTTIYMPMHYDTASEAYKKLDVGTDGIPGTATKLYYIAGDEEGNITPVTIDSVTYGTDKGNSITLTCGIMGNGYVIKSAKEGTNVTIEHKYSEIYTPVDENNLAVKCICSDVKTTIPGPVDPYANLVISETVAVGESGNLPVTTIRGLQQGEDYTTVTVPKDVKYISAGAFSVNRNLDTIYLPEGCQMESESVPLTTKIVYYKVNKDKNGDAVVETASTGEKITQVTVSGADVLNPDRVLNLNNIYGKYKITAIADNALDNSGKNLHTIILPNSVESINARVFGNCKNLETIYLKEGCTIENEGNIADKNLIYYTDDGATISSAKINIDNFQLELSQIRNGIGLKIGENAFKDQVKMKSVTIPATVTSIDAQAFAGCTKLTSIDIPASVTSIGTNPFAGCTGLQTITVNSGNTVYKSENGVLLSKDGKTLVCYPAGKTDSTYAIPGSVEVIAAQAFAGCTKLETITIPASVTSIGTNPFAGCMGLKAITVDGNNEAYKSDNGVLLSDNGTTLVCCPEGFADSTYTTPESVTAIAAQAFADCKKLGNVVLRENVTSVGADAFTSCDKLMAVYVWHLKNTSEEKDCDIDSTVLNSENIIYYIVADSTLSTNSSPKEVTIGKTTEDYDYKLEGGQNCIINRAGTELDLTVLNNTGLYKITCIGTNAFYQADEGEKRNNLKSIIIPEGVTTVNGGFLRYNQCLESVKLPTTLIGTLPKHSITDNKVLKTLTIPHQVTEIDSKAFEATTDLETVYVPSTITYVTPITNNSTKANIIYYHTPTEGEKGRYPEIFGEGNEVCIGKYEFGNVGGAKKEYFESHDSSIINREHSVIDLRTMDSNYQIKLICMAAFSRSKDEKSKKDYIEKIIVPEGVIHIDQCAFRWNHGLSSITLPTTLTEKIPKYCITDNATLQTLVIPHGVTTIIADAFSEATGLKRVYVPDVENFNTTPITNYSTSATIIRYTVTDENASPKKVKITDATLPNGSSPSSMEVYCDEMGDRYVITEVDEGARDKVALNHRGDVEVPAKEVSCTEGGNETYWKCLCGANKYTEKDSTTEAIAVGHTNLSEVPAKAATFHACGVKAHYKCEKCKALFEDQDAAISTTLEDLVIPEHKGHDFGAYSHDYENQALHADVCALKGTVAATCAICDQTDVKSCAEHTKSSHVWTKGEKIPATCKTTGTQAYTCSLCNESETKTLEIDPNNHDYSIEVEGTAKEATCTAKGKEADKKCSRCEAVQTGKEIEIDSNNHTYGEVEYTWSDDYTACTAKRVCNNDANHVETEEATVTSEATQEATCTQAEVTTYTATFNNEAFETQTKDVTGKIDPNNHTNVEKTEAKAATCTEAGNDEYWYCGGCKKYFEDKECTTAITDISKVTRPATGHDFESSTKYSYNSTQHWKKCSRCDEEDVNNKEEHKYSSVENKCDVCGYVTTPDTYTVSGTVYTWDNTDSNTTRVRLYSSTTSEADIKSDIQHDMTGESDTKKYKYDATVLVPEKVGNTNKYTQSFEFTGVANGEYKLAAWRPAYDIKNKHYAYAVRITDVTVNGTDVNVDENATKLWLYGDVTNNGKIEANDAANILAYIVRNTSSIKAGEMSYTVGDVTENGKIEANDAANILAFIVGNKSSLDDKK